MVSNDLKTLPFECNNYNVCQKLIEIWWITFDMPWFQILQKHRTSTYTMANSQSTWVSFYQRMQPWKGMNSKILLILKNYWKNCSKRISLVKGPLFINPYGQSWNCQSYKHGTNSTNQHYQPERQKNILIITDKLDECDFSDQGGVLTCV